MEFVAAVCIGRDEGSYRNLIKKKAAAERLVGKSIDLESCYVIVEASKARNSGIVRLGPS